MLRATDLWFRHSRRDPWVVEAMSLEIAPGEVVGLGGPSGAGKSTLGRLLAGHLVAQRGAVELDGAPIRPGAGTAYPVQLVMQHPERALDPYWKIAEVLAEARAPEPFPGEDEIVDPRWLDRFPHELSGGELQRVNLARALRAGPRYLVADEISASLDALTQARIWHLLGDLAREREIGVLAISHDRPLLERVASRILVWPEVSGRPGAHPGPEAESAPRPAPW